MKHNGHSNIFTKTGMGNGEGGGFGHGWVAQQRLFNLGGRDLLTSPFDNFPDTGNDKEISIPIEVPKVAGSKPAVPKCSFRRVTVGVISSRYGRTAQYNFSMYPG